MKQILLEDITYKDCPYEETIKKIKNILENAYIKTTEIFNEGYNGIYSVRVTIDKLGMATNGKGLSKNSALASAYGELMERLQNFALYKFTYPLEEYEELNLDFLYSPDEIKIYSKNLQEQIKVFMNAIKCINAEKLMSLHTKFEQDNNIFFSVPYYDYIKNIKINIPAKLNEIIYASNGMAAGNSFFEAMVQGISEVFERYANRIICEGKIIPPSIPIENLNLSYEMLNIISSIEAKGSYKIIFKDCSLGLGIPVIGMIFIDKERGKYFVKFGSHPIISVAAERTITELFQGRKFVSSSIWMKSFSFNDSIDKNRNFEKIFRDGNGEYPDTIFRDNPSYITSDIWYKDINADNRSLFEYLISIIKQNEWNLYYKDVSFLEFPSVHVIIPEISSIKSIDDKYIDRIKKYGEIRNILKNIKEYEKKELEDILEFIDMSFYSDYDNIKSIIRIPFTNDVIYSNMNINYFKFIIYFSLKNYSTAIEHLSKFIMLNNLETSKSGAFYRCLKEYVYSFYIKMLNIEDIKIILLNIYNKDIVEKVFIFMENENLLKIFQKINCFNCDNCNYKEKCSYPDIIKFHKNISKINCKFIDKKEKFTCTR